MKDFWKIVLATVCGLVIVQILKWVFLFMFIGSASSALGGSKPSVPREGVLDMNLSEISFVEQAANLPFPAMDASGSMAVQVGLRAAVKAIQAAAADAGVKYILLRPDGLSAGMADIEELRKALLEFRRSGKAVVAYTESPSNGSYYLATAADKIYMSSYKGGTYQMVGLSARLTFLKDLLAKLGVNVQLIRHGKYKSAGEMFIRSSSSPENREQNQVMVTSAWNNMCEKVCEARDVTPEAFNRLIDDLALVFPQDFLEAGLVDGLMDHEALLEKLALLAQQPSSDKLKLIRFSDYVTLKEGLGLPGRSNVAIIYADGDITDGNALQGVAGDRFVRIIDEVRKDASVKAVVLRVNSPGGSVSASAKIKSALDLLQKEKPLVASYGNYAASGGYWISNGCSKIYADANTITGSIGVFSMIPEFSKLTGKVGVNFESVNSNKHSDVFSLMRPFDARELQYMQASVEDIYETFVNLVADGRSLEPSRVDELAQGRVWIGSDALEVGLVDEIGTLEDAVFHAASLAGLSADMYKVVAFPKPLTPFEQVMAALGSTTEEPYILSLYKADPSVVYARMPWDIVIK